MPKRVVEAAGQNGQRPRASRGAADGGGAGTFAVPSGHPSPAMADRARPAPAPGKPESPLPMATAGVPPRMKVPAALPKHSAASTETFHLCLVAGHDSVSSICAGS